MQLLWSWVAGVVAGSGMDEVGVFLGAPAIYLAALHPLYLRVHSVDGVISFEALLLYYCSRL